MIIQINRLTYSLSINFFDDSPSLYLENERRTRGGPSSAAQDLIDAAHSVEWDKKDHLTDATCSLWFHDFKQVFTLKPVGAGRIIVKWPEELEISGYAQEVQMFMQSLERILVDWYYNQ